MKCRTTIYHSDDMKMNRDTGTFPSLFIFFVKRLICSLTEYLSKLRTFYVIFNSHTHKRQDETKVIQNQISTINIVSHHGYVWLTMVRLLWLYRWNYGDTYPSKSFFRTSKKCISESVSSAVYLILSSLLNSTYMYCIPKYVDSM